MRKSVIGACAGLAVWLALWLPIGFAARAPGLIDRLFLLAPLTIVPLALSLIEAPRGSGAPSFLHKTALAWQPIAAAMVLISFLSRTGVAAALLTLPWVLLGGTCSLLGLARLLARGVKPTEELCIDAALLYFPVGCGWLFIARLGANPMGFSDDIVLLTAVHFHYAGLAALIMLGMIGRSIGAGMLYRFAAWGAIAGIPLLALGITFSPGIEIAAAFLLAISLSAAAGITAFTVVPRVDNRVGRLLLSVSAISLLAAMLLAGAYALGKYSGRDWLDIPQMAALHGLANSLGFTLCGLAGWNTVIRGHGS